MKYAEDKETSCLTNDQARHIYKKVELEGVVNVDTFKQEIEEDKLSKDNIEDDEINQFHKVVINNIYKENIVTPQIEQWLILSNVVNYMQYARNPKPVYDLEIKTVDQRNHRKIYERLKEEDRQILKLDFGDAADKLRKEYLDMYEGVQSEVINTTRLDENSNLSMTYLGRVDITILEQGYMVGKVLDGMECQILLGTGASKSFMSKSHYFRCESLHSLLKFASETREFK